jgi:hypothetical protein
VMEVIEENIVTVDYQSDVLEANDISNRTLITHLNLIRFPVMIFLTGNLRLCTI